MNLESHGGALLRLLPRILGLARVGARGRRHESSAAGAPGSRKAWADALGPGAPPPARSAQATSADASSPEPGGRRMTGLARPEKIDDRQNALGVGAAGISSRDWRGRDPARRGCDYPVRSGNHWVVRPRAARPSRPRTAPRRAGNGRPNGPDTGNVEKSTIHPDRGISTGRCGAGWRGQSAGWGDPPGRLVIGVGTQLALVRAT